LGFVGCINNTTRARPSSYPLPVQEEKPSSELRGYYSVLYIPLWC